MTPVENHFESTKYIITGTVVDLLDTEQEKEYQLIKVPNTASRVKIEVMDNFKGPLTKGQTIEIDSDFSNCSLSFVDKSSYLLFIEERDGKYYNRSCSYSDRLEVAQQTLTKLKKWVTQRQKHK
ncbi:hypothetical protein GCM10027085_23800 [Spirosoma aerophilum]